MPLGVFTPRRGHFSAERPAGWRQPPCADGLGAGAGPALACSKTAREEKREPPTWRRPSGCLGMRISHMKLVALAPTPCIYGKWERTAANPGGAPGGWCNPEWLLRTLPSSSEPPLFLITIYVSISPSFFCFAIFFCFANLGLT